MVYHKSQRQSGPVDPHKRAYVCGLPGSGNRLLRDYLTFLGWSASIWHGNKSQEQRGNVGCDVRCIIPVRHPGARSKSHPLGEEDYLGEYRRRVLAWAVTVPRYLVSYEAICMDPEGVFRDLCAWLGEEYRPCPFPIYDANKARLQEVG